MTKAAKQKEDEPRQLSQQEFFTQAKIFTDYINHDWDSDKAW